MCYPQYYSCEPMVCYPMRRYDWSYTNPCYTNPYWAPRRYYYPVSNPLSTDLAANAVGCGTLSFLSAALGAPRLACGLAKSAIVLGGCAAISSLFDL